MLQFPGGRNISKGAAAGSAAVRETAETRPVLPDGFKLPTLPHVAAKVLQLARAPNSNATQIERVIANDQGLSAQILKFANSSFYGLPREICDIRQALVVLGMSEVERLMLATCASAIYTDPGETELALWDHAVGVAVASRVVAGTVGLLRRQEVFLAGLMHDVGHAVLRLNEPEPFEAVFAEVRDSGGAFAEAEATRTRLDHHAAGHVLAEKWQFPDDVLDAIRLHHAPERAAEEANNPPLVACVTVADWLCRKLQIGRPGFPPSPESPQLEGGLAVLNLARDRLEAIEGAVAEAYAAEKKVFER